MKLLFAFAIASALSLSAQNQTPAPAPAAPGAKPTVEVVPGAAPNTYQVRLAAPKPVPIGQLPASTVVATVDGQKVTAGQLQAILRSVPAQLQQKIEGDRKEFVTQYAMFVRLVDMARKEKLDQQ